MTEDSSPRNEEVVHRITDLADSDVKVVDVVERFRSWFAVALADEAGDETFEWGANLVQFPTGQQQPGPDGNPVDLFVSLIAVYVGTPGPVLNTTLMHSGQVQVNAHDEPGVREMVRQTVASLREARRRQPEEIARAQNGNGRPAGHGLILPG